MNLPLTRKYGGANKSNRILAEELAKNGCTVMAVTPALAVPSDVTHEQLVESLEADGIQVKREQEKIVFSLNGVEVHAADEAESLYTVLREQIRAFRPDWIFVSTEDTSHILMKTVCDESPGNIIYLAHTHYMLPFGRLSFYPGKKRTELIAKARSIITISHYMADYISQNSGFPTFVNHPPHFDTDDAALVASRSNKYVLMNNPCAVKGIDILLGLAAALPAVQFAVVPGWGTTPGDVQRLKKFSNITFLKSTSDLNSLFRNASLLLMPSIWEEGFGMTAIDAMLRGVPVIASNHGGLAEAKLGTNYQFPVNPIPEFKNELDENKFPVAVIPPQDITPWKAAIETLLADEELYNSESVLSREKALAFTSSLSVKPLIEHLRSLGGTKAPLQNRKDVLEKLTPEQKAKLIGRIRQKRAAETESLEKIPAVEKKPYYPVSFSQKQTLLVDEMNKGYYGSIIGNIVEHDGPIDAGILNKALNAVCRRHESFRTRFRKVNGEFVQEVLEHIDFSVEEMILHENTEQAIAEQMQEVLTSRFDLSEAPLLRFRLIHCSDGKKFLLYAMHHIISDGLSLNIFIREVTTLYRAFIAQQPDPFPPLLIQYKDYTAWQHERIENGLLSQARTYWHNLLGGDLPVLDLPADFSRPPVKTYNGDSVLFTIPANEMLALEQLGREQGASLFITLLSLVNVLLYRYTGQDDIIVGTPVAGRKSPELRDQVGYYVNMVALRNKVNGADSFTSLLNSVKNGCLAAYSYDEYPFDKLIEELVDKRDISRSPIFDIMVALSHSETERQPEEAQEEQSFIGHLASEVKSGSSHDMAFLFFKDGKNVHVTFTYNTDLFRKERVQRMRDHFSELLRSVIRNRDLAVSKAEMLSSEERNELLHVFNEVNCSYPAELRIQEQFEKMAARFPENVAVELDDATLTYEALNRQANRVAHELRRRGVESGEIIGVLGERSSETIIAILGILKAGGAYLPLDPDFPAERINYTIADSGSRIVLVPEELKEKLNLLPETETFWVNDTGLSANSTENPAFINRADDAAYIIYTSGSTGKPKGTVVQHNNVIRLFFNDQPVFSFSENDAWSLFHSFCFDFSVWEMYGALFFGGRIVIVPKAVTQDPPAFLRLLSAKKITILNQVPGAFYALSDSSAFDNAALAGIRYIIFGGDMLHPARLGKWKARYPDTKLINMYGITETTVHVTYKEITAKEIESSISNIGRPIPTLQVYVLDNNSGLLPVGVWGELCISGEGLSRGYLNQPELTAEKFIAHPFEKGKRMYRSGDLGRFLPGGDIEYLGRKDHQVQLRGYRIELHEIEYQLKTYPAVTDAAVLIMKDANGEPSITAYVVTDGNSNGIADSLREYLQQKLPRYMIPSFFMELEKLPLTANGKLDRKALPVPFVHGGKVKAPEQPSNETEAQLLEIWKEVLGFETIGVSDDFFELGGHSLKAVKITSQIHRTFNIEIRLGDFFENPTIRELAEIISLVSDGNGLGSLPNEVEIIL